jgi:AcrR family transcriptional regulator
MTERPDRPSLRQRQRQRTREEIEAAAFALFDEVGFDAATVEQIANRAGVATRTFFRHFPTKEDVVFGDQEELVARLRDALAARPDEPPLTRVFNAILAVQQPGQRPKVELARARLIAESPSIRARSNHLIEAFERAVSDTLLEYPWLGGDGAARARIVAAAIFGALRGARQMATDNPGVDPRQLVETAFATIRDGAGSLFASPESGARHE